MAPSDPKCAFLHRARGGYSHEVEGDGQPDACCVYQPKGRLTPEFNLAGCLWSLRSASESFSSAMSSTACRLRRLW